MNGGTGDDSYTYNSGDATIVDSQGNDTVSIYNGATLMEIQSKLSKSGDDLVIDFANDNGDRLTVKDFFLSQSHQVERIEDGSGAALSISDIYQALGLTMPVNTVDFDNVFQDAYRHDGTLTGSSLRDLLQGFNGDDTLEGGLGDDRLEGGNGNDTLVGGGVTTLWWVDVAMTFMCSRVETGKMS